MRPRLCAALALIGLVAGCVRLSQPAPAIHDYRLDYTPPVIKAESLPITIRVLPVRVAAIYDRQLIVYRKDLYSTGTYFDSRWSVNPGNMVADLLARDLAASGVYRAVQHGPAVLPSDYQLTAEIQEIEERITTEGCAAHLQLRILLLQTRAGEGDPVLLAGLYTGDDPCACNEPRALAEAMSRGLERISAQLQQEVYDSIRTHRVAPKPSGSLSTLTIPDPAATHGLLCAPPNGLRGSSLGCSVHRS